MSSLRELAKQKLAEQKEKPIETKDLKSTPVTKKPPKIKDSIVDLDLDDIPGYRKWCNSLETKRFYYYTKMGSVHRGTSKKMVKDLEIKQKEIEDVKEIIETGRGTKLDRKSLITELKIALKERNEKLAKQKVKVENGAD